MFRVFSVWLKSPYTTELHTSVTHFFVPFFFFPPPFLFFLGLLEEIFFVFGGVLTLLIQAFGTRRGGRQVRLGRQACISLRGKTLEAGFIGKKLPIESTFLFSNLSISLFAIDWPFLIPSEYI